MTSRVLICDDEKLIRWSLSEHLKKEGYDVTTAEDGEAARASIESAPPDAVVLDLKMPKVDGMSVLRWLHETGCEVPVIVITAHGGLDSAIEATKLGAKGYLSKPFDLREVSLQLSKILEAARLETEVRYLRDRATSGYERLIGSSPAMLKVFDTLKRLENVDAPTVLITGESGTGKDLVAQAIHARGPRKAKPFMEIDCAAMQEALIESELFGHEKGSFTDARQSEKGLFEVAGGGVIFLDELAEMTPGTQAKLLRAIENRKFRRMGGVVDLRLDAAIIAATNRDLKTEVKEGRFREDLFFRLNVVPIDMPPLRRRVVDIEPIALSLLERVTRELGRRVPGISREALDALRAYAWPGNVRELRNVIERVVILALWRARPARRRQICAARAGRSTVNHLRYKRPPHFRIGVPRWMSLWRRTFTSYSQMEPLAMIAQCVAGNAANMATSILPSSETSCRSNAWRREWDHSSAWMARRK